LAWLVLYPLVHPHLSTFAEVAIVEAAVVVWEGSLLVTLRRRQAPAKGDIPVVVALVLLTNAVALFLGALI
jgi:hypothetical protein